MGQPKRPLVILLALVKTISAITLMCAHGSECFSTPPAQSRVAAGDSHMRSINSPLGQPEWSSGNKENGYTANYITAIELAAGGSRGAERGFMVSSSDHNYAIYSPTLNEHGWLTRAQNARLFAFERSDDRFETHSSSVTVNGDQVFIVTTRNMTQSTTLFGLDEQQRDLLAEARSNFTQNLAGLKFAHYTSGSSTQLSQQLASLPLAALSRPSVASMAIDQMSGASGPMGHRGAGRGAAPSQMDSQTAAELDWPAKVGLLQTNELPPSAGAFFARSLAKGERSVKRSRAAKRLRWHARNVRQPATTDTYAGPQTQRPLAHPGEAPARGVYASGHSCSHARSHNNFNYYNLLQAPLNVTLAGDVYYFDLHCNILDVYSASVSVRQERTLSALYRDANFFSYARSDLPLAINRFFLSDEQVFFVYNDGSLLVKTDWMLDQAELDVVIEARQQLKLVGHWQGRAADLLWSSSSKKKESPAA